MRPFAIVIVFFIGLGLALFLRYNAAQSNAAATDLTTQQESTTQGRAEEEPQHPAATTPPVEPGATGTDAEPTAPDIAELPAGLYASITPATASGVSIDPTRHRVATFEMW